jgi:aldose 1-epimerase
VGSPSGEQIEVAAGDLRAVVAEVGGGLRTLAFDGREILDGYSADQMCTSGRGQVLLPWPNRLDAGRYEFAGRSLQLPLTEVGNGTAIHGLVRWANWTVREREPHRVVMGYVLHAQPGYPFTLDVRIEYALSDNRLEVTTTATNAGSDVAPFGAGAHPYFGAGGTTVDEVSLKIPARTVLRSDERGLPRGRGPVDGTDYDFRVARPIGAAVLDNAFTDLERPNDGRAQVELERTDGTSVALWVDKRYPYLMVFTGDPLPDVARRSVAVEPMTCPPNAFRTGDSLISLEPGSSFTGTWGVEVRQ